MKGQDDGVEDDPVRRGKYFGTPEAQAALFRDALESGHPGYIAAALGTIARARGMTEEAGLSRLALDAALREGGNPTLHTVMQVAKVLGVRLRTDAVEGESVRE